MFECLRRRAHVNTIKKYLNKAFKWYESHMSINAHTGRLFPEEICIERMDVGSSGPLDHFELARLPPTPQMPSISSVVKFSQDTPATSTTTCPSTPTANMRPILLSGHERALTQVKYNPDGDIIFSVSKDHVVVRFSPNVDASLQRLISSSARGFPTMASG